MENTLVRVVFDSFEHLNSNKNSSILVNSDTKENHYHETDSLLFPTDNLGDNLQQESQFSLEHTTHILMEENSDDQSIVPGNCFTLQTAKKSFSDVLNENHQNPDHLFELNTKKRDLGNESKVRKYQCDEDCYYLDDKRSNKHAAIYAREDVDQLGVFDEVLLISEGSESDLCGKVESNQNANCDDNHRSRSEQVDFTTILTNCAKAVSRNDLKEASETLKQIREYSSPVGNAVERLAHYFANGLEARIAGTGGKLLKVLKHINSPAPEVLKDCKLYFTACPFKSVFDMFRAVTITELSKNATSLHIVDFGILYGFSWPYLIECLSAMPGGPPKLRITGIDRPQPGFRPAERIEETGRLLAKYCKRFNVSFEYTPIVKKLETVRLEDLNIDRDEVTVATCFGSLRAVPDEMSDDMSSRDKVLELIRMINPDAFIHGVTNGSYGGPFFLIRFREALFHFSSMFDMFEATMSSDEEERMLCEKQTLEWNIMNVIACEGLERVERPETYRLAEARSVRAGLRQLALKEGIVEQMRAKVELDYHKDFMVSEEAGWLLLGWKGRVLHALSCWKST